MCIKNIYIHSIERYVFGIFYVSPLRCYRLFFALFLVYHSLHHHFLFMETTFDVLCVSATFALMLLFFMCSIYNRYQSSNSTLCCIYFLTDGLVKGIISSLLSTLIYDLNRQLSLIRCQPS